MPNESISEVVPENRAHPPREKLASLQILRGLAASVVVLHHVSLAHTSYGGGSSWIVRSGVAALGASGVDLFFVISGFIMMYTAGIERGVHAAKAFFLRRARRILPLYWAWTTIILLLWSAKLLFRHSEYRPLCIVCSYLLWPLRNGATFHPILDPGWTLTLEVFFYLLFGLIIAYRSRLSTGLLVIGGFAASWVVGSLFPPSSSIHYLFANSLLVEFGFGIVAAYLVKAVIARSLFNRSRRYLAGALIILGIAALIVSMNFGEPGHLRYIVWGIPCFCILFGTLLLRVRSTHSLLAYLGDASYSIYLGHFLLVVVYATAIKQHLLPWWLPADAAILIASAAIIAASSFGYRFLEKPLQRCFGQRPKIDAKLLPVPVSVRIQ